MIIIGSWLIILGIRDAKNKEIPMWFATLGGIIGLGFCFWEGRSLESMVLSCLPGVVALIFSKLTKEVMGYGDGIVLGILGLYLPVKRLLSIGFIAFLLAGVVALVLLVVCQKNGSYRIPFLPFLGLAYGIDCWISLGEKML